MTRRTNPNSVPLRQQVYLRLRSAIQQGTFAPGARLPPSREHARVLGVGRNTVLWAVERLQAEGYLVARVGDGSYVAPGLSALRTSARRTGSRPLAVGAALSRRGQLIADTALRWRPATDTATAFRIGCPAIDAFPFAVWERLARQTSPLQRRATAQYMEPAGHLPLRDAIAQWLLVSRGIRCDAAQVLVTSGSQQAIDLIGRLLLDIGDEVMVEDPGYPGIRASLVSHGATVRPVPVDAEGLDIVHGWSRTTTTASSSTAHTASRRCAACRTTNVSSTSAPFRRHCTPACVSGSSCCRRRWSMLLPAPRHSTTATVRVPSRTCWPASSAKAICCATCGACASSTRSARRC
jgi:GntR family transcriptional regulator/MocR family aminotransferase